MNHESPTPARPGWKAITFQPSKRVSRRHSLARVPKTLDECSPRALRILLVPNREPFFFRERDRDPLRIIVTLMLCALVAMVWIRDHVNLLDRMRRSILAKSALYHDVIMSF